MMAAVTTGADDFLSADKGDQWGGGESRRGGASLRPHSTPATLLWLDANYEMADGVCIPRNTLYTHYVHFCGENGLQPVNAASFGKIIRQQFPMLTTRRLGTRGQSRYHYYGIAIRETSAYFEEAYSRKGASVSDGRRDAIRQNGFSQTRYKLTTLLPVFPNLKDIRLPDGVPGDRVSSFFMMYRTHCERIFDTVMRASMEEVHNFLLHFWQGMPPHLIGILSTNVVVNMVGVCDSILYRTICNVLMQSVLQAVPDTLLKVIRKFAIELEVWLHMALEDLPSPLKDVKLSLAHIFSKMLKRQSSLNHLYQAAQMVILDPDLTNQMILDLRRVDLQSICRQSMYTMDRVGGFIITELITDLFHEFVQLLEGKATIETYTEWLESIIERCILNPANSAMGSSTPSLRQCARQFLLMWTAFGTKVIRDMTLHSAPSFGSFHLLHLMFDDYILHLIDVLHLEDRAKEMLRNANHNILTNIETQWESTDTEDTQLANSFTPYPTILLPDYVQLQNLSDDAQDLPERDNQGAAHGECPAAAEPFPSAYQFDADFRTGSKYQGRNYMHHNYNNQGPMDTQGMAPTSFNTFNEKPAKFINSSTMAYNSNDSSLGHSSQFCFSRRNDQLEMSANNSQYYQDPTAGMNSSGGYYQNYDSNSNYPMNRY